MKRRNWIAYLIALIFFLLTFQAAYASLYKWIKIGRYQTRILDMGDQGEASGAGTFSYYYYDGFTYGRENHASWQLGTRDWTDENDTYWGVKICGCGGAAFDEVLNVMPVPDEGDNTIFRYRRRAPVSITVDGFRLDEPFPLDESDEVKPEAIPGTAEIMVESWINTSMGISVHQKVLGWSQEHHDQYLIFDWTFTNTGNVDLDDEIELPNQTLEEVYFFRSHNFKTSRNTAWNSATGEYPTDSLRMVYGYTKRESGAPFDDFGDPDLQTGFLEATSYIGEAMLHVDKSVDDHSDDPAQPHMTGVANCDFQPSKNDPEAITPDERAVLYQTMQLGMKPYDGTPYIEGAWPGTHHGLRIDEQGYKYITDVPWWGYRFVSMSASGPYTFGPGDSIRIVWATVMGGIPPEKGWEIGTAWDEGSATFPGGVADLAEYYPAFGVYPELAPDANDQAKDRWVVTGKDSLFQNAWAAQWAVRNDYNVPVPPPAPSIEVTSLPDKVNITWGDESEVSDFAGYRVYRAIGNPDPIVIENQLEGVWEQIFECGEGTSNALTHSYDDETAERGQGYYYYVGAFDDGVGNDPGVSGKKESLESSRYANRTTKAAYLTRGPGEALSDIRVVPNPFNINARDLQYVGEPDKIMFLNLPMECTIKLYTESGDLVRTIEHSGSG
ncbi:hypothetical protein ACFL4K_03175, partial [Candidatus Neomarinimicrobiota bacterium]